MECKDVVIPKSSSVNGTDDREAYKKYWFVVETRMNQERKVRDYLENIGVECFLPSQMVKREWKHRTKMIEQLLIPMKVFVNIGTHQKMSVLKINSPVRFMYDRSRASSVVIPDFQMSQFMMMLKSSEYPVKLCDLDIEPGVRIRVLRGSLAGLEGTFLSQDGRSKVKVEMSILGSVYVEIPFEDIEVLKTD